MYAWKLDMNDAVKRASLDILIGLGSARRAAAQDMLMTGAPA